jgi:ribosome biogenesis GTPase
LTSHGIIVKGVGGFYDVFLNDEDILRCTARGRLRKEDIVPMVGDRVVVNTRDAVIENILPRKNQLKRPPVCNLDYLGIVLAVNHPKPDLLLVDKLILSANINSVKPFIIINKIDLAICENEIKQIEEIYVLTGCDIFRVCCKDRTGIDRLMNELSDGITTFAGQSGAGKSSLINELYPDLSLEVGSISSRIKKGRHTTRNVQLILLPDGRMVVDTPGFSAIDTIDILPGEVQYHYPEFIPYLNQCQFVGCVHDKEPQCSIKDAVERGEISKERYTGYIRIIDEIRERRREQWW